MRTMFETRLSELRADVEEGKTVIRAQMGIYADNGQEVFRVSVIPTYEAGLKVTFSAPLMDCYIQLRDMLEAEIDEAWKVAKNLE